MTKNRPSITPISFGSKIVSLDNISDSSDSINLAIVKSEALNNVDEVIDLNIQLAKNATEVKEMNIIVALKNIKKDNIGIQGAKIEGNYIDYMKLMMDKYKSNNKQ